MRRWTLRFEVLSLAMALALAALAGLVIYALQPATVTIAVAPRDGTEPVLFTAFAEVLAKTHANVRLKVEIFDDVRDSAAALEEGRADLAVVRPDVALPTNGLTLAVLRDQAMLVAAPAQRRIESFPDLAGKRLGIGAHREDDLSVLKALLGYYGLRLLKNPAAPVVPKDAVALLSIDEDEVTAALKARRVDAVLRIIAPTEPRAQALIAAVKAAAPDGKVSLAAVDTDDAIVARFPLLQSVTVQGGLFGGRPDIPDDDVTTIGASYRLMARASLSRTVAANITQHLFEMRSTLARATTAADDVAAPNYDTTAAATSARLPNHPGAIDYYEREQRTLLDRYGDIAYFLALVGGGLGSLVAWLRQRLRRLYRERIDDVADRLLQIASEADHAEDVATLDALEREIDTLAADAVTYVRDREPSDTAIAVLDIAIDTARSVLRRRRATRAGMGRSIAPAAAVAPSNDDDRGALEAERGRERGEPLADDLAVGNAGRMSDLEA